MAEQTEKDIKPKNKIAERIAFLRIKTELSQTDFAKKFDIDRQIINRWERVKNKRGVTIYTVQKFCNMVGITLKEFFDSETFNFKK